MSLAPIARPNKRKYRQVMAYMPCEEECEDAEKDAIRKAYNLEQELYGLNITFEEYLELHKDKVPL